MRRILTIAMAVVSVGCLVGCPDNSPPPPRVPVPSADNPDLVLTRDPVKPIPPPTDMPPEPYHPPQQHQQAQQEPPQ